MDLFDVGDKPRSDNPKLYEGKSVLLRCPLCKSEDPKGYGLCRDCGVPTHELDESGNPAQSRSVEMIDRCGEFLARVISVAIAIGFSFYLGTAFGSMFAIAAYSIAFSTVFGVILMVLAVWLIGWAARNWLTAPSIVVGSLISLLPFVGSESIESSIYIRTVLWLLCSSAAISSMVCGSCFGRTRQNIYIVTPIVWSAVVVLAIVLVV